ncbi:MAG: hypothetical protein F6K28_13160 [Microcoleus sp. SIO2G3]|nr:hypothetical protein [Microcoleus sp. SIO2G3]
MTRPSRSAIDNLADLIAASREVAERQMSSLNAAVERTTQNVDRAVQNMERSAERMEQSASRIETQVGVMSEHLTAIDIKIERLADKIDGLTDQIRELTNAVNGHLRVAEKQADNITELTKLVAIQANTVAVLINRTA